MSLLKPVIAAALVLFFSSPSGWAGTEIGNGRSLPERIDPRVPPAGDGGAPKAGQKRGAPATQASFEQETLPEGKDAMAHVEVRVAEGIELSACSGDLASEDLQYTSIQSEECVATRLSANRFDLKLRFRVPAPTVSRSYYLRGVKYLETSSEGSDSVDIGVNSPSRLNVRGSVRPRALRIEDIWIEKAGPVGPARLGEEFSVVARLRGADSIAYAGLSVSLDQGLSWVQPGFFPVGPIVSNPQKLDLDELEWLTEARQVRTAGLLDFELKLRVPSGYSATRHLWVTQLVLVTPALQEILIPLENRLGIAIVK